MKNILKLLTLLAFLTGITGCQKDDDIKTEDYFEPLEQDSVFFNVGEGEQSLALNTNLFVTPEIQDESVTWCRVEFMPVPPRVVVHVEPNPEGEPRSATVLLKAGQIQYSLYVRQLGNTPAIELLHDTYRVSNDATTLKVPFVANVTPHVTPLADWIQFKEIAQGKQNDTLILEIAPTPEIRRLGDVELTYGQDVKTILHILQQSADTNYVPATAEGIWKKVKVAGVSVVPESVTGDFDGIESIIDGDHSTAWSGRSEEFPVSLTFNFEDVQRIDYISYQPDGMIVGPFGKFDLYVQLEGETTFKKYGETYDFKFSRLMSKIKFDGGLLHPRAIRFDILEGVQAGAKQYFQCREMEFYAMDYDDLAVFTDETCSALKKEVTVERIMALENDCLRNLAMHLLAGTYDTLYRVQEYQAYMEPDIQGEEYKTSPYSYLDNATGISVRKGEEVVLLVGETHGAQISAVVMDWENMTYPVFIRQKTDGYWSLQKGVNIFTAPNDGLLYIVYNTENYKTSRPVKINIPSGAVNGYFDIARQNNADWVNLLGKANPYGFVDVKGKLTHLVFPFKDFRQLCPDNVERLLEVSDSVALLEHELSGYYKYGRMYPNRMFCRMTYETGDFVAFATSYHTAYITTAVDVICNAAKLRKECWAMAHELGHCHQVPGFKWNGMTEVSNNVFSLHVQTTFGEESRIFAENYYQTGYNTIAVPEIAHCECENVFTKLVPFWQLQLYFAKVLDQKDFYADLYEYFRTHTAPATSAQVQLEFVQLCCEKGNKDLAPFFEYWGVLRENNQASLGFTIAKDLVEQTRKAIAGKYPAAPAIQYLTDANIEQFRKNAAVKPGQTQLEGASLRMTGWENVVAYEVYERDKLIQVSLTPEFTLLRTSGVTVKAVAANGTKTIVKEL